MDKKRLCLLFGMAVFVCFIAISSAIPVKDDNFKEKVARCKELCGHCDCMGFYCGDECICECPDQSDEELNCVDMMQDNCEKLNLPFEVLIQGSKKSRLVRSLMYADPNVNMEICPNANLRPERSTISIYKPAITEKMVQKREAQEDVEGSNINRIEADSALDEEHCLDQQRQRETGIDDPEAEDSFQDVSASSEDSHFYNNEADAETENTLKELHKFLTQLGVMEDEDYQTGMHESKHHDKREVSLNEKSIADSSSTLQLPAGSNVNKRHIEGPFELFNTLGYGHKFDFPELLLLGGKEFLGMEKVKILFEELAEKGKLATSDFKFDLADLGIKKLAIDDLGLKALNVAELSKALAFADIGKKFAEIDLEKLGLHKKLAEFDLEKLGLDKKFLLEKLRFDKTLGSEWWLKDIKHPAFDFGLPPVLGSVADFEEEVALDE